MDPDNQMEEMQEIGETSTAPDVNARISILETHMQTLLDQMRTLTSLQASGDTTQPQGLSTPLINAPNVMPEPPMLGKTRWQLKDLKPPKYNGTTASWTADALEQWLSKWVQCFWLCNFIDDVAKIQQATYNLLDVAHRWWRKVEQDNAKPTT